MTIFSNLDQLQALLSDVVCVGSYNPSEKDVIGFTSFDNNIRVFKKLTHQIIIDDVKKYSSSDRN